RHLVYNRILKVVGIGSRVSAASITLVFVGCELVAAKCSRSGSLALLQFLQAIAAAHLIGSPDEPLAADHAALRGVLSYPFVFAPLGARGVGSLNSKLEQLREQNRRLDQENEHLAEMIQFEPQLDAAMLAPARHMV